MKLKWDEFSKKIFETGIDHVALYVMNENVPAGSTSGSDIYAPGAAWNGVTGITENSEGGDINKQYADNMPYAVLSSNEDFGITIEAFSSPEEFKKCDGKFSVVSSLGLYLDQQRRRLFAIAYRTKLGNDVEGEDFAYKLHIVYNCKAQPSETANETLNDSPEGMTKSWECTTMPVVHNIPDTKPTAHIELDSSKTDYGVMSDIEAALYGTEGIAPHMLMPDEIYEMFSFIDEYLYFVTRLGEPFMTVDNKFFKVVS